jgi:hypothetical protein
MFHIALALDSRASLAHPAIENNLGSYLLGSCSPDIRIITHDDRGDTHFASLDNQVLGEGTKNLFKTYPALADAASLSERTQAFLAGYISHLMADEAWIIRMYRPYFTSLGPFKDQVEANVMDRAAQLSMDQEALDRHNGMRDVTGLLGDAHAGVELSFLPKETLAEWRGWVEAATQRDFNWERLRGLSTRRQDPDEEERARQFAERFLDSLPDSLDRLYDKVPREALSSYKDAAIQEWATVVGEYLP